MTGPAEVISDSSGYASGGTVTVAAGNTFTIGGGGYTWTAPITVHRGEQYYIWSAGGDAIFTPEDPEQARQREERYRLVREERDKANAKARELFLACLTGKQQEQYGKNGVIKVTGSSRGRYLVDCTDTVYNVTRMLNRKPYTKLCAAPTGVTASYDIWLAQKLLLESDEQAFLRVANVSICVPSDVFDSFH